MKVWRPWWMVSDPKRADPTATRHQIVAAKIRALGMEFGGPPLVGLTIAKLSVTGWG
jgi:hypothetical protein